MPGGGARLAYAEHVTGQTVDLGFYKRTRDLEARASSSKRPTKKKSPSMLHKLARKMLGAESSKDSTKNAKKDKIETGDGHDSEGVRDNSSTQELQRMQAWLHDANDLLAASDSDDADDYSLASSQDSEDTLVPSTDRTPPNEEQERRTQGLMGHVESASREEWRDEVDSQASTLTEKDQPNRVP